MWRTPCAIQIKLNQQSKPVLSVPYLYGPKDVSANGKRSLEFKGMEITVKDTPRLDDQLVAAFSNDFLGYGANDAPVWFVGMEEGGGGSPGELARRFSAWAELERHPLQDIFEYHKAVGHSVDQWFVGERPKLQRTWTGLIRIQFGMQGRTWPS